MLSSKLFDWFTSNLSYPFHSALICTPLISIDMRRQPHVLLWSLCTWNIIRQKMLESSLLSALHCTWRVNTNQWNLTRNQFCFDSVFSALLTIDWWGLIEIILSMDNNHSLLKTSFKQTFLSLDQLNQNILTRIFILILLITLDFWLIFP